MPDSIPGAAAPEDSTLRAVLWELDICSRITSAFLTVPDENLHAEVSTIIREVLDSPYGVFGCIDEAGHLVCPSLTRDIWQECAVARKGAVFPRDQQGPHFRLALSSGATVVSNAPLAVPPGHLPVERAMHTPVQHAGEVIGLLAVANKPGDYTSQDQAMLERIAGMVAPVLRARLQRDREDAARRRLEEQLLQARKMEAVAGLAAGVAHDFNNLLTVINGHSRMLLAKLDPLDPLRQGLEEIRKAGDRAAELTQQLLALSRKQVLHPQVLDLNRVVAEIEDPVRGLLGPGIELHTSTEPALGQVRADPVQIQQVVLNLAVNARDAMPAGGRLTVETRNVELAEGEPGAPAGLGPGRYAMLSVSDTGHGMDDETRQRVFEPFFTSKELGRGTGLGLATVYGMVQQSGGAIEVHSEPGQGTTFRVYLPRVKAPAAEIPAPDAAPDAGGGETILLVEDQAEVRSVTSVILAARGYRVLEAADGTEALAWCTRYTGPIHLLFTDVVMPVMSGRQLAERMRALRPEVKVLYASGCLDEALGSGEIRDPAASFLPKPFTPEQLAAKVRAVLGPSRPWARILVVDDEPGVRQVVRSLLEDAGYEVLEAAHGGDALAEVRAGGIDLVITDLVMPEQEGIETIRTLHRERPEVRIIAMSGAFGGDFLRIAGLVGAHAVIPKPLDPARLLGQVRTMLAR